jgi:acyl-CoA synthetase (AMP-forming)/AMP-acid ligase II
MIHRSQQTDLPIPEVSVCDLVVRRFASFGERPAIVDGATGRSLSYTRMLHDIGRVAAGLAARGFGKGGVFAICCPNVPEYATALLAINRVGGIATTMNPLYTAEEIARQLQETRARFLLTIPALADRCVEAARGTGVVEIFTLGAAAGATPFEVLLDAQGPVPGVSIDSRTDLAAMPYSSGTSGVPKGVMLTHRNLVAQLTQAEVMLKRSAEDVVIAVLPFFHIYGLVLILLHGLRQGATLVAMPRFDFVQFLECVQKYRVNQAPLVPPIVLALAKHPAVDQYDLSSLRQIGCGAAPLGAEVERTCAQRLGCHIMQGYGMTEFAGASLTNPEGPGKRKAGSVGKVWPNMQARIVDVETGADLGPNRQGELWMRGPNVMRGYFERPDATRETLTPDGWLRTGDIAYADDDGDFFIVDRVKELIKHNAYQIAPAELEAVLLRHPAIADAAVIPSPDEETGEVPKAFVVLKGPVEPDAVLAFVAEHVAPYKKIRRIAVVEAIPKSPSGKILRRVLIEQERAAVRG